MPNFVKRGGIIPVVVQEYASREVIMLAYADQAAFLETLKTGEAVFFSTSRNERWKKGETSGDTLRVRRIQIDCDGDALVYIVTLNGTGVCHTGKKSCFWRSVIGYPLDAHEGELAVETLEVESGLAGS
jgi:phosphoribosyl-AMP cyclohydrolase